MAVSSRNLQLAEPVNELLELEKAGGSTITGALNAAVYWYFNRLEAAQREMARQECANWIDTGVVPPAAIASEVERSLRTLREQELQRLRHSSGADG